MMLLKISSCPTIRSQFQKCQHYCTPLELIMEPATWGFQDDLLLDSMFALGCGSYIVIHRCISMPQWHPFLLTSSLYLITYWYPILYSSIKKGAKHKLVVSTCFNVSSRKMNIRSIGQIPAAFVYILRCFSILEVKPSQGSPGDPRGVMMPWGSLFKPGCFSNFWKKILGRVGSHSVFLVAEIAQKRSKKHFTMPIRLGFVYADISMNKVPFVVEFALNSSEMTLSFRFLGCFASDGDVP